VVSLSPHNRAASAAVKTSFMTDIHGLPFLDNNRISPARDIVKGFLKKVFKILLITY